jgi:hypothetical protein
LLGNGSEKEPLMANLQTSKSGSDKNKNTQRGKSRDGESATGERDENYNLVSVLYHALRGAETAMQYQKDAERGGDEPLAQFLQEAREGYAEFARQAKELLAERLDSDESEEEEDEE